MINGEFTFFYVFLFAFAVSMVHVLVGFEEAIMAMLFVTMINVIEINAKNRFKR